MNDFYALKHKILLTILQPNETGTMLTPSKHEDCLKMAGA